MGTMNIPSHTACYPINNSDLPNTIGTTANYTLQVPIGMNSDVATNPEQTVDARTIDGEPFEEIIKALELLETGETLLLINSFEPKPLYNVLTQRGFTYETTQVGQDEWHVEIEQT